MSSEWQEVTVGDISSLVTKGTTPTTLGFDFQDSGIRFVKVETLTEDGHFIEDKFAFISEDANKALLRSQLQEEDILFTIAGTIGRTGIVKKKHLPANTNQAVAIVRPNRSLIEPRYLRYVLSNPAFTRTAQSKTVQSVQANFSLGELKKAKFQLPPMATQREILGVLGTLDDRITLLRETNTTLEAIAQALFKSWFVDFDPVHAKMQGRVPEGMDEATAALFPDSFEESELGEVPRGWRIASLRDCCNKIESGGTPKRSAIEYWNGRYSWLTSGEVRNPIVFETKETITDEGLEGSSAKLWPSGTTVIAMYGATAGEVCLIASPMTANQACCGLIPRPSFRAFVFFCSRRESENLASKSSGSAQQNLNKGLVENHAILLPSDGVVTAYEAVVGLLLDRWIESERHSQTLANLRDTLLPRLISGQLQLPDAQQNFEEAL